MNGIVATERKLIPVFTAMQYKQQASILCPSLCIINMA